MGGDPSPQRLALLEMIARTRLLIEHVDSWLMQQPRLVNQRRKSIIPALRERPQLVDSLANLLAQLGLERVAKPIPALSEYIKERESRQKGVPQ